MSDTPQIIQNTLVVEPWKTLAKRRLPGVNPLNWEDWILIDEAFEAQLTYRDFLLAQKRAAVFQTLPQSEAASLELLAILCTHLEQKAGYHVTKTSVTRPDGVTILRDCDHPMAVAGQLVQQDFCIMEKVADEHVLTGAILCFPSNWRLAEKLGHPMSVIHEPVKRYDPEIARRVQRIFDHIKPEKPVWRANYLLYSDANLFQPRRETPTQRENGAWVRIERQSLICLPNTKALVFGIHNQIVPLAQYSPAEQSEFLDAWDAIHSTAVRP